MWLAVFSMKVLSESVWQEYLLEDQLKPQRSSRKRTVSHETHSPPELNPASRSKSVPSRQIDKMPAKRWNEKINSHDRLSSIEDEKLRTKLYHDEQKKKKDSKISQSRDSKKAKMAYYAPQMRQATIASGGSSDPQALLLGRLEPQMFSMASLMPGSFQHMATIAEDFKGDLKEEILPQLKEFNQNLSALKENGVTVKHQLNLDSLASRLNDLLLVVLIVAVVCVMKPRTRSERILVALCIGGFLITRTSVREFIEKTPLMAWLRSDTKVEPQMSHFGSETAEMLCGLINMYVCVDHGRDLLEPKKFVRIVQDLGRSTASFQTIFAGMSKVVTFIFEGIDSWMNGRPFFLSTGFSYIDDFMKESDAIQSDFENKTLFNLQSSVDRVSRALEIGDAINMKVPSFPNYAGLRLKITGQIQDLRRIRKALLSSNFKFSGIRQEPVVLLLRGPPGVAKSMALQHFAHAISAITLDKERFDLYKEQPSTSIYNRQAENKYWDGYTMAHDIILFDDLLQMRDVVGEPDNEAMNLIRCANIFEAQLHCAAIESKGVTNCRAKWIMATTNSENFKIDSLTDIGAFMRRLDCTYDVTIKACYAVDPSAAIWARVVDQNKLPRYTEKDAPDVSFIGKTRFTMDCLEFHAQQLVGRSTSNPKFVSSGRTLSFDEVVKELHNCFLGKKVMDEMYKYQLNERLETYRREYHEDEFTMSDDDFCYVPQSGRVSPHERSSLMYPYLPIEPDRMDFDMAWFRESSLVDDEVLWWRNVDQTLSHSDQAWLDELKNGQRHNYMILVQCVRLFGYSYFLQYPLTEIRTMIEEWLDQACDQLFEYEDWSLTAINEIVRWDDETRLSLLSFLNEVLDRMSVSESGLTLEEYYGAGRHMRYEPEAGSSRSVSCSDLQHSWRYDDEHRHKLLDLKEHNSVHYDNVILLSQSFMLWKNSLLGSEAVVVSDNLLDAILKEGSYREFKIGRSGVLDVLKKIALVYCEMRGRHKSVLEEYEKLKASALAQTEVKVPSFFEKIFNTWRCCAAYLAEFATGVTGFGGSALTVARPSNYSIFVGSGMALGAGLAIKGVLYLVNLFFSSTQDPQSDERHSRVQRGRVGKRTIKTTKSAAVKPEAVIRTNHNMTAIMQMVFKTNLYSLYVPVGKSERDSNDTKYTCVGSCLGIKGRVALMPYHFGDSILQSIHDEELSLDDILILKKVGLNDPYFMFTVREFRDGIVHDDMGEKKDILSILFPKRFQPVRDIVKFFATEKQQDLYKVVRVGLAIPSPVGVEMHAAEARRKTGPITVGNDEYCNYEITDTYEYIARTSAGDCGSPLFVDDTSNHSVLIGMHVAGYQANITGVSAVLTREFVEHMVIVTKDDYVEEDQLNIPLDPPSMDLPNMNVLGKINPEMKTPGRMGRSQIVRSPLYGRVDKVTRMPARLLPFKLSNGKVIDPLEKALAAYCTPDVLIGNDRLSAAVSSLADMLDHNSPHIVEKEVFSFEQAVLGDGPGSEFSSVPRVKSAGFPYNTMPGNTSKCRFFGTGSDYDLDNPECLELKKVCKYIVDKASEGTRVMHVFTDSLKDERRSISKVQEGKTRMFSGSPTPLLIVSRQYFGAFQKWIIRNRIHNGIAIGVNEYSSDWDLVARRLLKFGVHPNVGAGDYQGFDQKHKAVIMWAVLAVIQRWYGDKDKHAAKVREILWYELTNSRHVVNGHLIEWPASMPSGHPLTALVNCLYNHILFRMCWIDLINPRRLDAHSFNEYVYLVVLGDDNVFSVHPSYADKFSELSLQNAMKNYGEVYTPEDKELVSFGSGLRRLEDVTFLKRKFVYSSVASRYIAPLDLASVLDILNWNRKGANTLGDTEDAVDNVLCELSLHGSEVFEYWKKKILIAVQEASIRPPANTNFRIVFRKVLARERGYFEGERFLTDYDEDRDKDAVNQPVFERSEELQARLFNLTSRMALWQPHRNPGTREEALHLAQWLVD